MSHLEARPRISFFSNLNDEEFEVLISRPDIQDLLVDMGVQLRVAVAEYSEVRAQSIQTLNEAGIPVYIWLQATENQGYTFRVDNASSLLNRYQSFKKWSTDYGLIWQGIGIDLRPRPEVMQNWTNQTMVSSWNSYRNLFKENGKELSKNFVEEFVKQVKEDGYPLETYILPYAMDGLAFTGPGFQYLDQKLEMKADKQIPFCFTSFDYISPAAILDYGKRAQNVAIGSTNPNLFPESLDTQALSWEQLSRDLRLAHDACKEIHIYNLESVVANGWLEAISEFDFSIPVFLYSKELEAHEMKSFLIQNASFALSYPVLSTVIILVLSIAFLIFFYFFIRYLFTWKKPKPIPPPIEQLDYEVISG